MDFVIPQASLDFTEVDGRSSDVIHDKGRLKDIEKSFPVRIYKEKDKTIAAQLRNIAGWLYLSREYEPLLFSEYNEYFYKALGYSGTSGKDLTREWLDIDFVFKCQPYVFRLDGEDERDILNGQSITNPEIFTSLPIISFNKTTAAADSNIYINGQQFRIAKEAGVGIITMDCENGIAYKDGGVNVSKQCFLNTDGYNPIILKPGKNEISFNNINQFKIKPRWRNLAV
ncbi:Phage-related protein [Enterococcus malodoratus]|uniref:phage tail protein n=1 Tax=Enterococcus malodoratus TaxID=71451 RepID=UPI0008BAEAE5|nr:phage tail protein [Enterococcus malodoratus]SET33370.1 Phage-related protein [Enterococcus malodoratus]